MSVSKKLNEEQNRLKKMALEAMKSKISMSDDSELLEQSKKVDNLIYKYYRPESNN